MNMDKMMGADFEKGLGKFKTVIESMPAPTAQYEIKEVDWSEKTFIGKRGTYSFDKLSAFFGENYPKIFEALDKTKVAPSMAPSAIYFKWDQEKGETDCAAVTCVQKVQKLKILKYLPFLHQGCCTLHIMVPTRKVLMPIMQWTLI